MANLPIVLPPFFMSPFFLQSGTCALGLQAGDLGEELRQGVPRVRERSPQTINLKDNYYLFKRVLDNYYMYV